MKDLINFLYRNHSLGYKLLLFISTTFLIVYLFPKSGKFKYNFEKGKPWQSENLYAPFNFAIKKTDAEIKEEKQQIEDNSILYFELDEQIANDVRNNYKETFTQVFPDSLKLKNRTGLYEAGIQIINSLYQYGVLNEDYDFSSNHTVVILNNRIEKAQTQFSSLISQREVTKIIQDFLSRSNLEAYNNEFIALFFDVIAPDLTYNKILSDKALQDEIDKISYARGIIEKETLIVSKGEVVGG